MLAPACNNDSDAPPEAMITISGSAMLDDSLRLAGASVDLYVGDDAYPWQTVTTDHLGYFHFELLRKASPQHRSGRRCMMGRFTTATGGKTPG